MYIIQVGVKRWGGNISVFFFFFIILYKVSEQNFNLITQPDCLKFTFIKLKTKQKQHWQYNTNTKPTHFPLRGMIGQLSKKTRAFCWSMSWLVYFFTHVTNLKQKKVNNIIIPFKYFGFELIRTEVILFILLKKVPNSSENCWCWGLNAWYHRIACTTARFLQILL